MKINIEIIKARLVRAGFVESKLSNVAIPWLKEKIKIVSNNVTVDIPRWELLVIISGVISQPVQSSDKIEDLEFSLDDVSRIIRYIESAVQVV